MRQLLIIIAIVSMLVGCDKHDYVDVEFKVWNKTEKTVTLSVTGRSGSHSVTLGAGDKGTLAREKGSYGIYMLDYLFEECNLYEGGRLVKTYSNETVDGFFAPDRWVDALDRKGTYSDDDWDDECTYTVLPEDLE
ncbi:MAG: hypothetical protein II951_04780 [Bacteroidales bacterium]|nr:hypothetical protein [Bacteroidales bacterium]